MKDSHEYAQELQRLAAELLARPAFPVGHCSNHIHLDSKAEIVDAVKALGSGKKTHGDSYFFDFVPAFAGPSNFTISCPKSLLCRKVQEEVWACDPLLAEADEAAA